MKPRNIRGMWLTELIKMVNKCIMIQYAVVDKNGYICSLSRDIIGANAVADEMNTSRKQNTGESLFKMKRVVVISWF